jgi:hypothetical protein
MHICIERSGGFAGIKIRREIDTESLPACRARRLNQLLEQSRFFDLPQKLQAPAAGADRFRYTLTIQDACQSHTVEIEEAAVPADLRPLLEWLMAN